MSACKSEDDCTHMPWCRINSKCYGHESERLGRRPSKPDPERARLVAMLEQLDDPSVGVQAFMDWFESFEVTHQRGEDPMAAAFHGGALWAIRRCREALGG